MTAVSYTAAHIGRDGATLSILGSQFTCSAALRGWIRHQCQIAGFPVNARRQVCTLTLWRNIVAGHAETFTIRNYQPGRVAAIQFSGVRHA